MLYYNNSDRFFTPYGNNLNRHLDGGCSIRPYIRLKTLLNCIVRLTTDVLYDEMSCRVYGRSPQCQCFGMVRNKAQSSCKFSTTGKAALLF